MAKRKLSDKQLRELQMKQGNGRGPGSRFGGIKEKPKHFKETLKKILQYISYSKVLLIVLIVIVVLNTIFNILYWKFLKFLNCVQNSKTNG